MSAHRSGLVVLAGRPNVGKSTLTNRLVGDHVAAVSSRPQTTRRRVLGAVTGEGYQIVLVDLPGFQRPFDRLTERMQRAVDAGLADADVVLFLLDATEEVGPGDRFIAARVLASSTPCVVAVNKADLAGPAGVAQTLLQAASLGDFHAFHPISAARGDGVEELREELAALLPEGPAYFPAGQTSDQTAEERVAELVREAALELVRDEVPHAIAVEVEEIEPAAGGRTVVEARILCETASQKGILIGRHGAMIKDIGSRARPLVESALGRPVYLALGVRVRPRWRRDAAALDRLGV